MTLVITGKSEISGYLTGLTNQIKRKRERIQNLLNQINSSVHILWPVVIWVPLKHVVLVKNQLIFLVMNTAIYAAFLSFPSVLILDGGCFHP